MNPQGKNYYRLRIREAREEARDFKTIIFAEGHNIHYKAGQYITLVLVENGEELRRSYSITSSPFLGEPLAIGVKRVENGIFSRRLIDRARPGDELIASGSGGLFVLPDDVDRYKQLVFFAAGSGITPTLSLIKTALFAHAHLQMVLVYSNASVEKAIYLAELEALQQQFGNRFRLELLFSNAADLSRARLHRDLILSYLQQFVGNEERETLFYICGPESYMRLCIYTLQGAGIDPSCIKKENFYFSNVKRRDALPPDTADHTAIIRLGNEEHLVQVSYPDAILRAAKKQGLVLPYSCEAGRCGNCVARCVKGTVWHSYNEVLTEKELQQGLILTCVGHPVGGDVILEI